MLDLIVLIPDHCFSIYFMLDWARVHSGKGSWVSLG